MRNPNGQADCVGNDDGLGYQRKVEFAHKPPCVLFTDRIATDPLVRWQRSGSLSRSKPSIVLVRRGSSVGMTRYEAPALRASASSTGSNQLCVMMHGDAGSSACRSQARWRPLKSPRRTSDTTMLVQPVRIHARAASKDLIASNEHPIPRSARSTWTLIFQSTDTTRTSGDGFSDIVPSWHIRSRVPRRPQLRAIDLPSRDRTAKS